MQWCYVFLVQKIKLKIHLPPNSQGGYKGCIERSQFLLFACILNSLPLFNRAGVALLSFGMACESEEKTTIVGTRGRMVSHPLATRTSFLDITISKNLLIQTIESPGHCPTKLTVKVKGHGRGEIGDLTTYDYPLPEDTEEITKAGGFNYPNSAGFCYEAAAVARCIAAGKKEVPQYTLAETLVNLKLIEEIQKQLGVKPVGTD